MTFIPLAGAAAFLYLDFHPDWFFIPGGSAPQGLWHVVDHNDANSHERGNWIIICPPLSESEHRQLFVDEPPNVEGCTSRISLKQIAAAPGDRVIVDFPYIVTPLRTVEAIDVDQRGVPLPRPVNGYYSVPADSFWVLSQAPRSVDSRYYGPITTANIKSAAQPIWTLP